MTGKKEQFLLIKPKSLNGNRLPVTSSVVAAARHNLREFDEPNSDIDTSLTQYNRVLFGPRTSAGIVALKNAIQEKWGYEQVRKDASVAVEVIVSLKHDPDGISIAEYFHGAAKWVASWYKGELISAVLHADQEYPHCHAIIMLDVGKGKPSGTKQIGDLKDCHEMSKAFERQYSAQYGVKLPPPLLSGPERRDAARQVHQHMADTGNPMVGAPGWPYVVAAIDKHPARMARELGLTLVPMSALRKLAESPGKGPMTRAAEAAQDSRAQAARAARPAWTESGHLPCIWDAATPMGVAESAGLTQRTLTSMGAASPASPCYQLPAERPSSCVGVPVPFVIQGTSQQGGGGLDDVPEDDEPYITRPKESAIPSEYYDRETGGLRPPPAKPKRTQESWRASNDDTSEEAA